MRKNLDYLYKSDSEIKLKTNHSYFTQCILQMAGTNRKFVTLLYGHPMVNSLTLLVLMTSCERILNRN